jgi:hypothetical protein
MDVQEVRLIDVFVIAPFLIYVSNNKNLSKPIRLGLFVIGVSTLIYNGHNYLKNIKR